MFRYPGGKSKLKKRIGAIIKSYYRTNGAYSSCRYVEPFIGGGAIGRELFDSVFEIAINDYDIGVAAYWHSVINNPKDLCDLVDSFIPTTDEFYKFKDLFLREDLRDSVLNKNNYSLLSIGFKKMALHQMSFSGMGVKSGTPLGGIKQTSKYKVDCRWNPKSIKKNIWKNNCKLSSIDVFGNTCFHDDFFVFINNVLKKSKQNFIYLDPPYYEKGQKLYQFFFDAKQHEILAKMLKEIDCPWLLSYDCAEEIRDMYSWAKIIEIDVKYTLNTKSGSVGKKEFLIVDNKYKYLLE